MKDFGMFATPADACREYARNVGAERPDVAWILTDYDTYEKNPFYVGPRCMREGVDPYEPDPDFLDLHAACCAGKVCLLGYGAPVFGPVYRPPVTVDEGGDVPF